MSGEELKTYLKERGLTLALIADELGISPQNLNGKLKAKSLKSDFITKVKEVIDKCSPSLPSEMDIIGSNVNGSNSSNVTQSIGSGNEALQRENDLLRQQNDFLQKQVETLLKIVGNNKE